MSDHTSELECSSTILHLPRSHWHCTFANFEWDRVRPQVLRDRTALFCSEVQAGAIPHMLLSGEAGIGKSHLGVALYRWGALHWGTLQSTWVSVPDFCDRVKRGFSQDEDPFEEYELARKLVVLDDLFGRELSQWEASNVVYRLINVAYQNGAALVVTMNQPATQLKDLLPGHEVSRLLHNAAAVPMAADYDYRRSRAR